MPDRNETWPRALTEAEVSTIKEKAHEWTDPAQELETVCESYLLLLRFVRATERDLTASRSEVAALVVRVEQLQKALASARPFVYNARETARSERQGWRVDTAHEILVAVDSALKAGASVSVGEPPLNSYSPKALLAECARLSGIAFREGLVTVWDNDGTYLGCIGAETWAELVIKAEQSAVGEPEEEQ